VYIVFSLADIGGCSSVQSSKVKVQSAKFDNVSVNDLKTPQVSEIYDVVNRHLSNKFGVYVPFPSRDNNG
jgi:ribosomal protein S13